MSIVKFVYESTRYTFTHPDRDHIGRWQEGVRGFYELPLLEELRRRLENRRGIIVDVGAHVGNHTVYFARVIGRTVVAFEPNAQVLPYLTENLKRSGVSEKVTVLGAAATGYPSVWIRPVKPDATLPLNTGMQRFEYCEANGCLPSDSADVRLAVPVDAVIPQGTEVALVKIDVEGFESEVLEGMRAVLTRHKPLLAIEAQDARALDEQRQTLVHWGLGYEPSLKHWGATPVHIWSHK